MMKLEIKKDNIFKDSFPKCIPFTKDISKSTKCISPSSLK